MLQGGAKYGVLVFLDLRLHETKRRGHSQYMEQKEHNEDRRRRGPHFQREVPLVRANGISSGGQIIAEVAHLLRLSMNRHPVGKKREIYVYVCVRVCACVCV